MILVGINHILSERQHNPIKLAVIGTGEMGTDILAQTRQMQGVKVLIAADRTPERAAEAAYIAGYKPQQVYIATEIEDVSNVQGDSLAVTNVIELCCELPDVDVVIEATGRPEVTVKAALLAMRNRKHFLTLSVECDITVGHILYKYARRKGLVYSIAAGDEPPAVFELYDFAKALGFEVIAVGKGKNNPLDRWATPQSVAEEARRRGVHPYRLTEFVDGTKTMVEMASVSNATGLLPDVRGMHGPHADLKDLLRVFAPKEEGGILNSKGVVDYAIGDVAPAVFLIFTTKHPRLIRALELRTMGKGPNYLLIRPFHLCSIEVPLSAVFVAIQQRPVMAPYAGPFADVLTVAKTDLAAGTTLDTIGGPHYFGLIEKKSVLQNEKFLPIGLAEGAILAKNVKQGEIISLNDVEPLQHSLLWEVWRIQELWLQGQISEEEAVTLIDRLLIK
ncbi:MAG: NAD(P)-binding domain-containing protein [Archaeoglobaceae archaeon]